jgi:hypothetical protein
VSTPLYFKLECGKRDVMVDAFTVLLIVLGLAVFEIITSIDNAVINADVLLGMSRRAKRWFLVWGLFSSVFLVRGLLPLLIVWAAAPTLGPVGAFTGTFSEDPSVLKAVYGLKPPVLIAGGVFLMILFFHWLFMEEKSYGLKGEKFIQQHGLWFYTVASIVLAIIAWFGIQRNPFMGFGAVVGSTAYFITHGFRQNAEENERKLVHKTGLSDLSKLLYLEVIDATFSIDGVLGAFAFTLSVPLILVGNGLAAVVMRELTVRNIGTVKKYRYLKNGAMYSILLLGLIMVADSFGVPIPEWLSPIITFSVIGFFFWKSMVKQ